jgi:hypothetical protein
LTALSSEHTSTAETETEELLDPLLGEREQLKSMKQQEEAASQRTLKAHKKQQDSYLRTQTEKLKQDLEKQLADFKEESTDHMVAMQALFKKQMKAQLDITREITDQMMTTVQGMLATMQEELMQRMEAMLHHAMAGTAVQSSATSDDQTSKKRRKGDGDAVGEMGPAASKGADDETVDMGEVVNTPSNPVTSTGHTFSSLPLAPDGVGGGGN